MLKIRQMSTSYVLLGIKCSSVQFTEEEIKKYNIGDDVKAFWSKMSKGKTLFRGLPVFFETALTDADYSERYPDDLRDELNGQGEYMLEIFSSYIYKTHEEITMLKDIEIVLKSFPNCKMFVHHMYDSGTY